MWPADAGPDRRRIALVGFGRFGRIHALRLQSHPAFVLACVVDTDAQARAAARATGLVAWPSLDALPPDLEAASVVTPADTHADVAVALLSRGLHVLVEKPLATHEGDIQRLLAVAHRTGRLLCTGHIERFNACLLSPPWEGRPQRLDFERQSTAVGSGRSAVMDLMVHDIDLAAHLLRLPGDAGFRVVSVAERHDQVRAEVDMGGCRVALLARHGAERSSASLRWGEARGQALELSVRPAAHEEDALTRQYTAFHHLLAGRSATLADAQAGAVAARRALAILAEL